MNLSYIWEKILRKFGFVRKQEEIPQQEYSVVDTINFTDFFANSLKNLALTDSKIQVIGTSKRAVLLNNAMIRLRGKLGKIVSFMLGYGGVVVIPYVVNDEIYFNIIKQDDLAIDKMNGDEIAKCAVLANRIEKKDIHSVFYRFVHYELNDGVLSIKNVAQRDMADISLTDVPEWAEIPEEITISGVTKMPFAFIRCPKDNRENLQIKGVPITFGADTLINEAKECLCQIEYEYGAKQARMFIDDVLFGVDNKLSKEYVKIKYSSGELMDVYSPDLRDESYYNRITNLFTLIEKAVGTSNGILTKTESRGATATEIKASLQDTFAIISDIRDELEKKLADYVLACDMLANYYSLTQFGDYELDFDWSYSMVESSQETFTQMAQAQSMGAVSKAEIRMFIFNEDAEEAEAKVKEIEASEPSLQETMNMKSNNYQPQM